MSDPREGRLVEVGGRKVHLLEEGEGTPVVLLHGWGSLAQEILCGFSGVDGLRLLAPDRPGYGFSDPLDGERKGPDAQAAWLAELLDALDLDRPVVVGHSFGASVAASLATTCPDRVGKLMLLAPFCRPTQYPSTVIVHIAAAPILGAPIRSSILPRLLPLVGPSRMAAVLAPNPVPAYLEHFPYAHLVQERSVLAMAAEIGAFNGCMARWPSEAGRYDGPTAIVAGARDTVACPDRHVAWLQEHLPQAEVTLVDEAGHAPHHMAGGVVRDVLLDLVVRDPGRPAVPRPEAALPLLAAE